jgi:hypothetical protein
MTWWEAAQVASVILVSLGGGGAIVGGLSGFLGRVWADRLAERQRRESESELTNLRGRIDQGLARLDATLEHQTFLLQRFADIELQGILGCWKKAIHSQFLVNGIRPMDAGTDVNGLQTRLAELHRAHNELLSAYGEYDPFLDPLVSQVLGNLTQTLRLELSQARREPFTPRWWEQGEENRATCETQIYVLRAAVQARVAALRRVAETAAQG